MKAIGILVLSLATTAFCSAQKDSLTIGPGDLIHISVLEDTGLDQHVRVTDSGMAPLILGGNVELLGLTPEEAAGAVKKKLIGGHFLLNPHVSVSIEHSATQNVSVVGQVRTPGSYEIDTPRNILDVVALAGGLTALADRTLTIERRTTKQDIQYFVSNDSNAALKDQPSVFPGDTVVVPKASVVYVLGDVAHPGGFAAATNDSHISVLQAVALAGGTPPNAVPSKARLIRKASNGTYSEMALPLSEMQKGKSSDLTMQADDIIYVPFSYIRNMVINLNGILAAAASASIYRF